MLFEVIGGSEFVQVSLLVDLLVLCINVVVFTHLQQLRIVSLHLYAEGVNACPIILLEERIGLSESQIK